MAQQHAKDLVASVCNILYVDTVSCPFKTTGGFFVSAVFCLLIE